MTAEFPFLVNMFVALLAKKFVTALPTHHLTETQIAPWTLYSLISPDNLR